MRLGAQLTVDFQSPEEWIRLLQARGYRAAFCPVTADMPDARIEEYRLAALEADIVIAEVGGWNINPLSDDPAERDRSIAVCTTQLELAEKLGAACCVSLTGSCNQTRWDGPHPDNLSERTFDRIVRIFQRIIDAVDPHRTFYTFEPMPWLLPDGAESYERLLAAIDRPAMAVHYDPVNLVNSPLAYYRNGEEMKSFIRRLNGRIKAVHLKDIVLAETLTVHLSETLPGLGQLDYPALLAALDPLGPDLPLLVEHLQEQEQIDAGVAHVRGVARSLGIEL